MNGADSKPPVPAVPEKPVNKPAPPPLRKVPQVKLAETPSVQPNPVAVTKSVPEPNPSIKVTKSPTPTPVSPVLLPKSIDMPVNTIRRRSSVSPVPTPERKDSTVLLPTISLTFENSYLPSKSIPIPEPPASVQQTPTISLPDEIEAATPINYNLTPNNVNSETEENGTQ
jgi:hypothetical protein